LNFDIPAPAGFADTSEKDTASGITISKDFMVKANELKIGLDRNVGTHSKIQSRIRRLATDDGHTHADGAREQEIRKLLQLEIRCAASVPLRHWGNFWLFSLQMLIMQLSFLSSPTPLNDFNPLLITIER